MDKKQDTDTHTSKKTKDDTSTGNAPDFYIWLSGDTIVTTTSATKETNTKSRLPGIRTTAEEKTGQNLIENQELPVQCLTGYPGQGKSGSSVRAVLQANELIAGEQTSAKVRREMRQLRTYQLKIGNILQELPKKELSYKFSREYSSETDLLKQENASLKTTIEELQELLSEKYSSKKLLMFCITASIALIFNLVTWSSFDIYFVHPILTIIGLIGTVGFGALAFWRGKCQAPQT